MTNRALLTAGYFDPRQLPGCLLWLDSRFPNGFGSAQPFDGDPISSWTDLSGNGRHVSQATAARRPLWRSQGRNLLPYATATAESAAQFTGTSAFLSTTNAQFVHGSTALSVQPANMLPNPSFETNVDGWVTNDVYAIAARHLPVVNLMPYLAASVESSMVPVTVNGPAPPTWSLDSSWSVDGGYSVKATASSSPSALDGVMVGYSNSAIGVPSTVVTPGQAYTAEATIRNNAAAARTMSASIKFRRADGSGISEAQGASVVIPAGGVARVSVTATAPAGAGMAVVVPQWAVAASAGDTFSADCFGIYAGTTLPSAWVQPLGGGTGNLLPLGAANASEVAAFFPHTNAPTLAVTSGQFLSGGTSLAITSPTAAIPRVGVAGRYFVEPGKTVTATISSRAAGTSRSFSTRVGFLRADGTTITEALSSPVDDTTTGWVAGAITTTVPVNTAYIEVQYVSRFTAWAAGEVHYIDQVGLWEGSGTTWAPPATAPAAPVDGAAVLRAQGGAYTRQAVEATTAQVTASASVSAAVVGEHGVYSVTSPTPASEVGPGRRYAKALNGPGVLVEEATTNLILNPSFEAGNSWWSCNAGSFTPDTNRSFVGGTSARYACTTTSISAGMYPLPFGGGTRTPAASNTAYTCSAYLWSPVTRTFTPGFEFYDASGTRVGNVRSGAQVVPAGVWTRIVGTSTSPSAATSMTPVFYGELTAGDVVWFDACQVEQKPYATSYCDGTLGAGYAWDSTVNLLPNGSFETDLTVGSESTTSWLREVGITLSYDTSDAPVGARSLRLTKSSDGRNGNALVTQIPVTAGLAYTLSYFVRTRSGAPGHAVELRDASGASIVAQVPRATPGTWTRYVFTGTATTTGNARLFLRCGFEDALTGDAIAFDGVQVEQRSYATPFGGGYPHGNSSTRTGGALRYTVPSTPIAPATLVFSERITSVTSSVSRHKVTLGDASSNRLLVFRSSSGVLQGHRSTSDSGAAGLSVGAAPAVGDVVMSAVTWDGSTLRAYTRINSGEVTATSMAATGTPGAATSVYIGDGIGGGYQANDPIDNAMVFNTALDASTITSLLTGATAPSAAAARTDCIFSAFVNDAPTAANQQVLTPGGWTRLAQTRTTGKAETQMDVVVLGPSGQQVYVDAVQLERAAAATTFNPNGPGNRTRVQTAQVPVVPGRTYTAVASMRAASNTRPPWVSVDYYSGGTIIGGGVAGASTPESASAWGQGSVTFTVPANATGARVTVSWADAAAREVHYLDALGLWEGTSTSWVPPVSLPNGMPVIQFDGVDDSLLTADLADLAAGSGITAYAVAVPAVGGNISGNPRLVQQSGGANGWGLGGPNQAGTANRMFGFLVGGGTVISSIGPQSSYPNTVAHVYSGTLSTASGAQARAAIDGVPSPGSITSTAYQPLPGTRYVELASGLDALFCGVVLFSGVHDDATRKRMERYLASIFGLTVAA